MYIDASLYIKTFIYRRAYIYIYIYIYIYRERRARQYIVTRHTIISGRARLYIHARPYNYIGAPVLIYGRARQYIDAHVNILARTSIIIIIIGAHVNN